MYALSVKKKTTLTSTVSNNKITAKLILEKKTICFLNLCNAVFVALFVQIFEYSFVI